MASPARLPQWLRKGYSKKREGQNIRHILNDDSIHTVCESALCPNRGECFSKKTVTFMILGNYCTRNCRFCAVENVAKPQLPDVDEPQKIAELTQKLDLKHVVITSVTRDDLPDGGATHFAQTIVQVKKLNPSVTIEVLTPDFLGNKDSLKTVLDAGPEVFNHNIETVPRLYPQIRPQADYARSLAVLAWVKQSYPQTLVKSGLMVGVGETVLELEQSLADLKKQGVDIVTIGQYLAPSRSHFEVAQYITPEQFEKYKEHGEKALGIPYVFAGPFVRSSYMAAEVLFKLNNKTNI